MTKIPENYEDMDIEHEGSEYYHKLIIIFPEAYDVLLQRINLWDYQKQSEDCDTDARQQEKSPELGHVAIDMAFSIPMRSQLVRHLGLDSNA